MSDKVKTYLVDYESRKCLICGDVYAFSCFVSLRQRQFFVCVPCLEELKAVLK